MSATESPPVDPCIVADVQPLLTELAEPVTLRLHPHGHPGRDPVEGFVRQVFLRHYGARLDQLYPTLLAFHGPARLHGVVGVRDCNQGALFAEQYLDGRVETTISDHWRAPVTRADIVEVGNLALAGPGEARWLIAAITAFLHARGYRWVLFTAVQPLVNAFARLGLNPIPLAEADPARLADGGRSWGSYYAQHPVVCVGDIVSGFNKLTTHVGPGQPHLLALLDAACRQGAPTAALRAECSRC